VSSTSSSVEDMVGGFFTAANVTADELSCRRKLVDDFAAVTDLLAYDGVPAVQWTPMVARLRGGTASSRGRGNTVHVCSQTRRVRVGGDVSSYGSSVLADGARKTVSSSERAQPASLRARFLAARWAASRAALTWQSAPA
jgi:hypothetical protein